jgi:protein SCO1/2
MKPALLVVLLACASPSALAAKADIVENLNQPVPLGLEFTNQAGKRVTLAQYFGRQRPVVITPVYYECPVLCSTVLRGVIATLKQTGLKLGEDFDIVTYSIDPKETPAQARAKRTELLKELGSPPGADGWDFLTGDEASIRALSERLGFRYEYDAQIKQYVHAAAFMILTPEGRISRYVYGVRFPSRDVRLGLVEAGGGKVGTSFDRFLLTCTRYDPLAQKYRPYVWGIIRGGGLLVFFGLAAGLFVFWRRELKFGSGKKPTPPLR